MNNIMNNNFKLIGAMEKVEGLNFNSNKLTESEESFYTTYLGYSNHYFIWSYEDRYDLWYCDMNFDFDEDSYTVYEGISLDKLVSLVKESNF